MNRTTYDFEQCSPEWFACRMACVTASEFHTVMAKGQGKTRKTYMLKLIGEILTQEPQENYSNAHMERGKELEEEARILYETVSGNTVEQVGFIKYGDKIGCSPDGLVDDDGLIEIKTRLPHLQLEVLLADKVPPGHIAQCQGGLWVSGREWIDFISYCPKLKPFIKRLHRDEEYISKIEIAVNAFLADMDVLTRKLGYTEAIPKQVEARPKLQILI